MGKRQISLDKVLNDSWKRMVQLLFRPFDFKFWLIIGFCAWMTILSIDLGSLMSRIVTPFFETMEQSVSVENAVHHVLKGTDGTFWSRLLQELEPATGIIWLVAGIYVVYLLLCLAGLLNNLQHCPRLKGLLKSGDKSIFPGSAPGQFLFHIFSLHTKYAPRR